MLIWHYRALRLIGNDYFHLILNLISVLAIHPDVANIVFLSLSHLENIILG